MNKSDLIVAMAEAGENFKAAAGRVFNFFFLKV